MNFSSIATKLRSFFNWPAGQPFNLNSCGDYLKSNWLTLLLFGLVVIGLIWIIKHLISMFKELSS